MSHTSIYSILITKQDTFLRVCREMGHTVKMTDSVKLYGSNHVSNAVAAIYMAKWRYPVALCQDGKLAYDNFGSELGSMDVLGQTIQSYNEQAILEMATYDNYYRNELKDGSVELCFEYN